MVDATTMVRKPSIEQIIYFLRLVEGEDHVQREARQHAFRESLGDLVGHLEKRSGQRVDWRFCPLQTADPYVSQPLATIGWLLADSDHRVFQAKARTYADGYLLHVRYLRQGEWSIDTLADMRRTDVWVPSHSADPFGQQFVFTGIARPEDSRPLAAQALRLQMPPRQGIGELQTCGFGQSHIFRGSSSGDMSVFLYALPDLQWGVDMFLASWLPRWEFHYRKLDIELAWCESLYATLESQASAMREAVRRGHVLDTSESWEQAHKAFSEKLTIALRRKNTIETNLENLKWLLGRLEIVGPDTYFASSLRTLRSRSQQLTTRLVSWQRTRDEFTRTLLSSHIDDEALALPVRGDLSRIWLNSQQPQPVLSSLRAARRLSGWPSRGWINAALVHFPDQPESPPNWMARRHDFLHLRITGPRTSRGYALDLTSSVLGQFAGTLVPLESPELQTSLDALRGERAELGVTRTLGELLFRAIMGLDRESIYRSALELARATGHGLAIRIQITNAPQLEALPWECLYDPTEDSYLAASAETPFARVRTAELALSGEPPSLPLRVLYAMAIPRDSSERFGIPRAKATVDLAALRERLMPLIDGGQLSLESAQVSTRASLLEAIASSRPHLIHLAAFGVQRRDSAQVLLQSAAGRGRLVSPRFLQETVNKPETKLLFLSSPDTASSDSARALLGIAHQLAMDSPFGIIAPQHTWRADEFFSELCRALAQGIPIDVATSEARRRVLMENGSEEQGWESPQLLLPSISGQWQGSTRRNTSGASL